MPKDRLTIIPGDDVLGAEVQGLDTAGLADDELRSHLSEALVDHKVLVARGAGFDADDLMAVGDALGEPTEHPIFPHLDGYPPIVEVINLGPEIKATSVWHSDVTFEAEPPSVTMLSAMVLPEGRGDTLFADQEAALHTLPAELLAEIDGASALHVGTGAALLTGSSEAPSAQHPVVRTHPRSERRSLFVNDAFTTEVLGLPGDRGSELVRDLVTHGTGDEFVHRHRWQPGDFVIWDNRSTLHFHVHDYEWAERRLLRITLAGDRPR